MAVLLAPTVLFYYSHVAHTVFLACLVSVAVWNGSTFYMSVFVKKAKQDAKSTD